LAAVKAPALDLADRPKGDIGHRLDNPLQSLALTDFAERCYRHILTWRIAGMAPLAIDPGLIGRIRGAFGERLAASASATALQGEPCSWSPPSAFEAIWRKQGRMTVGLDHVSPWVLRVDPTSGDLDVSIIVFGVATEWTPAILEAMTAALRHDVDWPGRSGLFAPRVEIKARRLREETGIAPRHDQPFSEPDRLSLTMLTPLALTGADPREKPASLIIGLLNRLEGIARWHEASLIEWADMRALKAEARSIRYHWTDTELVRWTRGSNRQDKWIAMRGLSGTLTIEADQPLSETLLMLITLGEACHFGADIAFGCGRYEVCD
jgi:hypothetical protein